MLLIDLLCLKGFLFYNRKRLKRMLKGYYNIKRLFKLMVIIYVEYLYVCYIMRDFVCECV